MNDIREYPGYVGAHTRNEAVGAFPNGTRIRKCLAEEGDAHPVGVIGSVLGSIAVPETAEELHKISPYCYFVEWDDQPKKAVFTAGKKIEIHQE